MNLEIKDYEGSYLVIFFFYEYVRLIKKESGLYNFIDDVYGNVFIRII